MPVDSDILIRRIEPEDNAALASIIRRTLEEFGVNRPGTVYYDATTDTLYELFSTELRSAYFVAEKGGKLVGGGGIYPTDGLPTDTCELVKMYLLPEARGTGLGKHLIQRCITTAKEAGFQQIYLESMPELKQALNVYERLGFHYLDAPLGNSGHTGCGLWMIKSVEGNR